MNIEELISKLTADIESSEIDVPIEGIIKSFMEDYQVTFTSTSKDHYQQQIPGLQAWDFARSMPYDIGTAFCYLWRAGKKGDKKADPQKALDHLEHFIQNDTTPLETYGDLILLFEKFFPERIALALLELYKYGDAKSAINIIQGEINETA